MNDAINDPMSENISTKYYEPYELTQLMKNTTNNMSLFHLNISSFAFATRNLPLLYLNMNQHLTLLEME